MKNTNITLQSDNTLTDNDVLVTTLAVNTYDIDIAGHVNNIVYIRWLEDMRTKLFEQLYSLSNLLHNNYYLVVISCDTKYKRAIKLFDTPIGKMYLQSYSHGVLSFKAEIKMNNQIAFSAIQCCVLMNLETNKMFLGDISEILPIGN